jgi:hypothetical protein
MRKLFLGMFMVILLAGCGQPKFYYDRPGSTPAMFERESAECKHWAHQAAAKKAGSYAPFSRDVGLGAGREAGAGSFEAVNEDQYYRAYDECLQVKGWKKVSKPQQ